MYLLRTAIHQKVLCQRLFLTGYRHSQSRVFLRKLSLQYYPLDEAKDEIRLLTLHPGKKNSSIQCSLRNVPLGEYSVHKEGIYKWSGEGFRWAPPRHPLVSLLASLEEDNPPESDEWPPLRWQLGPPVIENSSNTCDAGLPRFFGKNPDMSGLSVVPDYEALSYTWGDPKLTTAIHVNGVSFPVTQNLFNALKRLRKMGRDRVLWVDAICIDQSDLKERSKQVRRMRAIYQRAQRVVVWLGDGAGGGERAIDLLEMMGGKEEVVSRLRGFEERGDWAGPQFNRGSGNVLEASQEGRVETRVASLRSLNLADPAKLTHQDWKALGIFFLRSTYWSRAWIIQELAYARSIKLYCGSKSLGWKTLEQIFYNRNVRYPKTAENEVSVARYANLLNDSHVSVLMKQNEQARNWLRAMGFEWEGTSLLQHLINFRAFQSTDPRDKVYALLGLPSISDDVLSPAPDYSLTCAAVFQETTRSIIRYENSLRLLCFEQPDAQPRPHDLPSWCPNWARRPSNSDFEPLLDVNFAHPNFRASLLSTPQAHGQPLNAGRGKEISELRQTWDTGRMIARDTEYLKIRNDFSRSNIYDVNPSTARDRVLVLDGIHCGIVQEVFEPVPHSGFGSGIDDLKAAVLGWQNNLGAVNHRESRQSTADSLTVLEDFMWTIFKGSARMPPEEPGISWPLVMLEKYQIWAGQLRPEDAFLTELHAHLDDMDDLMKHNVRGWTFGIACEEHVAMLPARTQKGDIIAVLFGGDVPFVVRPVKPKNAPAKGSDQPTDKFYELIGSTYVHSKLMYGEAMERLDSGQLKRKTFMLV